MKIAIFIASSERFSDVEWLTPFSIQENATKDYPIHVIRPESIGMVEHGCTGFTNVRWAVPELCREYGYDFGIYLDVDMLVLGDIAELAGYATRYKWVCLADGSNEVSVICSTLKYPAKEALPFRHKGTLPRGDYLSKIPLSWNVEDRVGPGMKLLHFTSLANQPWFHEHPDQAAVNKYREYYARYHHRDRAEPDSGSSRANQPVTASQVRL